MIRKDSLFLSDARQERAEHTTPLNDHHREQPLPVPLLIPLERGLRLLRSLPCVPLCAVDIQFEYVLCIFMHTNATERPMRKLPPSRTGLTTIERKIFDMADSKINTSPVATPEVRLERLLHTCRRMSTNLDQLLSALSIVDNAIPDRENKGGTLSDLINLLIVHQCEEHTDFISEIRIAAGEEA